MSSGVTLITLFSLLMVGHFTPMGINSSDRFSHPMGGTSNLVFFIANRGSLQMKFIFATNGGSCQVIFFFHSMKGHFKGFFIPKGFIFSLFYFIGFDFSPF
jgi:hypothetical protein